MIESLEVLFDCFLRQAQKNVVENISISKEFFGILSQTWDFYLVKQEDSDLILETNLLTTLGRIQVGEEIFLVVS